MAKDNSPDGKSTDLPPIRPHKHIEEQLTRGERRQKKDWVTRAVPLFSLVSWAAAIVMLVFLQRARPEEQNFLDSVFNTPLRTTWNTSMLRTCLVLLVSVFFFCLFGFILNISRQRRETDSLNKSIIVMGIVSLLGIVVFLLFFWQML